ncbi:MAG: biopolymer transporter ExbD [Pseudomonadota bacterium]
MDIGEPPKRPRAESIVPMINVVFLLLIFFLMTAQISPPEPFELEVPVTDSIDPADTSFTLYVSAEGELAFEEARGEAVYPALTAAAEGGLDVLHIRSDQGVDAAVVAGLLKRLPETGIPTVKLVSTVQ